MGLSWYYMSGSCSNYYPGNFIMTNIEKALTKVWRELFVNEYNLYEFVAALEAHGLEIRKKHDD